jgi:hypothetical protein
MKDYGSISLRDGKADLCAGLGKLNACQPASVLPDWRRAAIQGPKVRRRRLLMHSYYVQHMLDFDPFLSYPNSDYIREKSILILFPFVIPQLHNRSRRGPSLKIREQP